MQARIPFDRQQGKLLRFVAGEAIFCAIPLLLGALLFPLALLLVANDMVAFGSRALGVIVLIAMVLGSGLVLGAQGASLLGVYRGLKEVVATDAADQARLLDVIDRLRVYFRTEALFAVILLWALLVRLIDLLALKGSSG